MIKALLIRFHLRLAVHQFLSIISNFQHVYSLLVELLWSNWMFLTHCFLSYRFITGTCCHWTLIESPGRKRFMMTTGSLRYGSTMTMLGGPLCGRQAVVWMESMSHIPLEGMWQVSKEVPCLYAWSMTRMAESLPKYLLMVNRGATHTLRRYEGLCCNDD